MKLNHQNCDHSERIVDLDSLLKEFIVKNGNIMSLQTNTITRYNDEDLEEFRVLISNKVSRARGQLKYYEQQLQEMADNPDAKVRGLDDGTGTAENEATSSMALRQKKLIQHLENALIRIQNKTYGVCRESGRLISKERLRAVPHATLSIAAKQNRK